MNPTSLPLTPITAVLVEIVATRGSTPRDVGAKMWVTAHRVVDSIGGGQLEHQAVALARSLLAQSSPQSVNQKWSLAAQCAQCCGGEVELAFRGCHLPSPWLRAPSAQMTVMVLGAGHVGRALIRLLANLPVQVDWVDNREEQMALLEMPLPPTIRRHLYETPMEAIDHAPGGTAFVVMTHRHDWDFAVVEKVLQRADARYLGMIGSKSKAGRFRARLRARAIDPQPLQSPIGEAGIIGKEPEVIALAIATQLMRCRPLTPLAINNSPPLLIEEPA